jgi:hypothetical protein
MDRDHESPSSSEKQPPSVGEDVVRTAAPMPELLRQFSEEELKRLEKALLRKIDLRLLPSMILIYIMNYLDR